MEDNSPTMDQPNTAPTASIPDTWPGAWGIYSHSKRAVMLNIVPVILLFLISLFSGVLGLIPIFGEIASTVIGVLASVALALVLFAGVNGDQMSLGESIKISLSWRSFKYFINTILLVFIAIGSLLLFIIPFFFIFPRVALAPYFVALDNLGPVEAISASWNATKGHIGKIYGLVGVTIVFGLLCLILIGIYFTIMYAAAFVILFAFIKRGSSDVVDTAAIDTTPVEAPGVTPTPVMTENPASVSPISHTPETQPEVVASTAPVVPQEEEAETSPTQQTPPVA